jgi:TolA-binding protein
MNASRLLLLSIILAPALLPGQKKEDLISIQRDVAQLEDQMKQLQKALDDKTAALNALLQQSVDTGNKTDAAMTAMQRNLDQKLVDQQTKLVAPVATLGTKVDEMSGDLRSVRENVAEMVRHMNDLDSKMTDILSALRTLQAPAPPPPPATQPGTAAQASDGPPAGWSAEMSYQNAYRDYQGKKDDTALEEVGEYVKYAPQSENAPNAAFYIGQIYYRNQQWPDAVKAFDSVLEQYPKNSKTAEAQYMKACALMNDKQKTAAAKEFRNFIANYPDSPRVKDAHEHLRQLGMDTNTRRKE